MKKTNTILTLLFILIGMYASSDVHANYRRASSDADFNIKAGLGLVPSIGTGSMVLPPIGLSAEKSINDNISLGGYIGLASFKEEASGYGYSYKTSWTYTIIGGRGNYHFGEFGKIKPYVGAFLGYFIVSTKTSTEVVGFEADGGDSASGFGWSAHAGASMNFSDNIGAFAEIGHGISLLRLGLSIDM